MLDQSPATTRSIRFSARDGLVLHARCYDAPGSSRPPVLCLAGLTRNSRDFHDLAVALSSGPAARTVWALDSRGRGLSERDPDWKGYSVLVEAQDAIELTTVAGLHGATIVGTSRGGILAMIIAAMQPTVVGAVVLNDIGPVIEQEGLARIAGYVGRMPLPGSWPEATTIVSDFGRKQFPDVTQPEWEQVARAWYNDENGRPVSGYDPDIARAVTAAGVKIPELWPQFEALSNAATLVLRGEYSDILGAGTVERMLAMHPNCAAITVPRQGHAPLLKDRPTIEAICRFIEAAEAGERIAGRSFAVQQ